MRRVLAIVLLLTSISASVAAQTPKPTGGVTITPAFQRLEIGSEQPKLEGSFTVQNNAATPATFELSTVNMGTLDETGGLIFSGLPQDYQNKYGLAEWIELPKNSIVVAPHKVATVSFNIKNEASLSPGGHYGAIIVKQDANKTSDKQVTISPQAASLLFLLKRGGETYGLSLSSIKANYSIWSLPTKVEMPFKNEGNVHVVPSGIVRLKNTFGDEIAKAVINPESSIILPERRRKLGANFADVPKTIWPGRYRIEVEYRYDGSEEIQTYTQTFYTANLKVLLTLMGSVIAILFILYKFRRLIKKLLKYAYRFTRKHITKLPRPRRRTKS